MRLFIAIYFLFFIVTACYAQAPENPIVEKRKIDSLYLVLKNIPEHSSKKNDTIRLATLFELIKKIPDDTATYYLNYLTKECDAYSSIINVLENKTSSEIQDALKKDVYLNFYLKLKPKLLRYVGGHEKNDENKLKYFFRALKISEKTGDKLSEASSYVSICYVYYQQSVYNKAIDNLILAQHIFLQAKNEKSLAVSYRILGDIYLKQGEFNKALQSFSVALQYSKKTADVFLNGVVYERIGNCYIDLGDFPKAIENHFASLKVSEQLKDIKGVGDSYGDIASIYYRMKDYEKCRINWVAALFKYKEFGKAYLIATGYKDVAEADYRLGKFDEALLNLDSALVIYKKEKEFHDEVIIYTLMSDAYLEKHDFAKTIDYLNKAIALSKKNRFIEELKNIYKVLADLYVKRNDYKTAYAYHLQFVEMKDSLANYGNATVENITEMQAKFDKEKNEQEKLLHDAVVAQKEAQIKQEQTQRYALYGGLALLIIFSVFVFNRFRITQKQNRIIEKQKQMVDEAFKDLEEKNKEVMDSITYARRIQKALITSEIYIEKQLNRLNKKE